jgi:hypothetical protein
VVQSGAEVPTQACECSLKCLESKIEYIYLITKKISLLDVNEPVSGGAL